jgi:hypothetical protein
MSQSLLPFTVIPASVSISVTIRFAFESAIIPLLMLTGNLSKNSGLFMLSKQEGLTSGQWVKAVHRSEDDT